MRHVTRMMLGGSLVAMTAAERRQGRFMRAPDGHEGGDPPAGDPPAGDPPAAADFTYLPAELLADGAPDPAKLKAHIDGLAPAKAADLPASADAYTVEPIEGLDPEQVKTSPLFQTLASAAHKAGLGNAAFNGVVKDYATKEIARSQTAHAAEIAALGETAQARIDSVANWLSSKMTQEEADALQGTISTAAGIKALEKLMGTAPPARDGGGGGGPVGDTKEEIEKLQASPEYYDRRKRDPAVVKRVQDFYAKQAAAKA